LMRSLNGDLGFEQQNRVVANADLSMAGYKGDDIPVMQKRMADALAAIPGVESVGFSDDVPLGEGSYHLYVFQDNAPDLNPSSAAANPIFFNVSPGYFRTEGTVLMSGRAFTWHDDNHAPRVAVVNEEFARRMFGSQRGAIGRFFKEDDGTRVQVVGIAEDGKYQSLTEDSQPAVFLSILQSPSSRVYIEVLSNRDPMQIGAAIRRTLRGIDKSIPFDIETRHSLLGGALFAPRMATIALGVMGVMGAILAITGIFGMAAYSVSKRLRELGIRVALGAQRRQVLEAALGRALKLLTLGSAAGLVLGILASRVLASIVYQATPRDPLVLGGVVLIMVVLGLVATLIPAQRALSVDPLALLREE